MCFPSHVCDVDKQNSWQKLRSWNVSRHVTINEGKQGREDRAVNSLNMMRNYLRVRVGEKCISGIGILTRVSKVGRTVN